MPVRGGQRLLFVALLAALVLGSAGPASATLVYETQWGSNGTDPGQFQTPEGIAGGAGGAVYVADSLNDRIQKFDADGNFLTTWGLYGTAGNGRFSRPAGVATDFAGNVYVADSGNNRIQKFDSSGVFLAKFGSFGAGNGQFNGPYGVATDATGNVYVADTGNNRIQKFDSSGAFLFKWGTLGSGNSQFNSPTDLAIDGLGDVYVTDSFNYRVKKFDSNGAFLTSWGSQGSVPGQFNAPYGIEVDSNAGVVVSDSNNHRVQRFTTSGNFLSATGTLGSAAGEFKFPTGVGAGSGKIYAADSGNDRIERFTADGVIEVRMDAVPDGPQDFAFTADGGLTPSSFQLDDDGDATLPNSQLFSNVAPGSGYAVGETLPPGWQQFSATCSDGSDPGFIEIEPGELVTCTFVNRKLGNISVTKDAQPDDAQDFEFTATGLSLGSFQLDDDGSTSNGLSDTQAFFNLQPGNGYSVAETVPTGWHLASATCSDGSPVTNIDLSPAENVACTFTNVKPGNITIVQDTRPNGPQDFGYTTGGGLSPASFQLDDDGDDSNGLAHTIVLTDVVPGSGYSVSQGSVPGWVIEDSTCSDGSPVSNIDVSSGEQITCTFGNSQKGRIVVTKDARPDSTRDFDFTTGGGLSPASFQLDDDGDDSNGLASTRSFVVDPGSGYSVAEAPTGSLDWTLESAGCSDGSSISNIGVSAGEMVTCTFVNRGKIGSYPRPRGATPLRVSLVPAFNQCTVDNRMHGPPLAFPSCSPPAQRSSAVTVGTPDANGAVANSFNDVRVTVFFNPGGVDDTDVGIETGITDLRCKAGTTACGSANVADGSDFTGQVQVTSMLRITDPLSTESATVVDTPLSFNISCAATASTAIGSQCLLGTSVDALIPGAAPEGWRSVWQMGAVQVFDGGTDGQIATGSDNSLLLTQGVFVP
jgi:streptogramin lyase